MRYCRLTSFFPIVDTCLDIVVVGEKHCQSIDAETPATGRRQSILERRTEVLINKHCFIVAGRLVLPTYRRQTTTTKHIHINTPSTTSLLFTVYPLSNTQQQPFYVPLSGTTRVSRYQKKHSPTHQLVSWSLTSLFSTNMAISETTHSPS